MIETLVPIAFFLVVFGIVYVIVAARNRERMSMIEKGADPRDLISEKPNKYSVLKWSLLLLGVGLGLFIGSLLESYTTLPDEAGYFASALFFGGLGLFAAFLIASKAE